MGAEAAATLGRSSSESSRIANAFLLACIQKFVDMDVRNDYIFAAYIPISRYQSQCDDAFLASQLIFLRSVKCDRN